MHRKLRYEDALRTFGISLMLRINTLGKYHPDVATCCNNMAEVLLDLKAVPEAKYYHEQARNIRERSLVPDHPDLAQSYNNIAAMHLQAREFDLAELLYKQSISIYETLSPKHPLVAVGLNNLANVYWARGNTPQALVTFRAALTILREVLGPLHPWTVGTIGNIDSLKPGATGIVQRTKRVSYWIRSRFGRSHTVDVSKEV